MRISEDILRKRIKKFQDKFREQGLDGVMLRTLSSYSYFTGIKWLRPGLFIPSEGEPIAFISHGEEQGFAERTWIKNVITYKDGGDLIGKVTRTLREFKIKNIGMKAKRVFMDVESLLGVCDIKDGQLYYEGKPLRINDVKKLVEETSREFGFDIASEPPIFSMGREAAQFHNRGSPDVILQPGESIIFDFFPRDEREKYWWDQTRTYVVGYVPARITTAYDDVLRIQEEIIKSLKPGMLWREADILAHKLMKRAGYATLESPANQKGFREGYGHAIGHGVGLNIHEAPWLRYTWKGDDVLNEGMVFSIEPGVYFPNAKKPYGIRIEDLVVMTERGAEILVEHPKTLEDAVIQI